MVQAGQAMDMRDSIVSLDVAIATIVPNSTVTMPNVQRFLTKFFRGFFGRSTSSTACCISVWSCVFAGCVALCCVVLGLAVLCCRAGCVALCCVGISCVLCCCDGCVALCCCVAICYYFRLTFFYYHLPSFHHRTQQLDRH